eukprot:TRINITY_DN95557_c0_g1_i1.p3 TRINITY_DN95557_c0_g1~~TRINITY_DN95557_c0_g1_i1.p3  ORF type:complete len:119 (+),score=7.86 TRINITY_DN95557_c0_g1_i1:74-430(+)
MLSLVPGREVPLLQTLQLASEVCFAFPAELWKTLQSQTLEVDGMLRSCLQSGLPRMFVRRSQWLAQLGCVDVPMCEQLIECRTRIGAADSTTVRTLRKPSERPLCFLLCLDELVAPDA